MIPASKDAYWFQHDSNAKDDPKVILLIEQLNLEGYGIYWVLIETLRDQPDYRYPMNLIPALSRRYLTSAEKMAAVILNYGLFETDGEDFFFSPSLRRRMACWETKRQKLVEAGKKGGLARTVNHNSSNAQAMLKQCSSDAQAMLKQCSSDAQAITEHNITEQYTVGQNPTVLPFEEIVSFLNEETGASFKHTTKATQAKIRARFKESYTVEDFKTVISYKAKEWGSNAEFMQYLRPETLFGTKFESYLQAAKSATHNQDCADCFYLKNQDCEGKEAICQSYRQA